VRRKRAQRIWLLIPVGAAMLALAIGLVGLQSSGSLLNRLTRGAALLGYQALFLAILSSAFMKRMLRIFGRPFIKVHHTLSATGLTLLTLHPVGVAISAASARVLLPQFESPIAFLRWGGAPALLLFAVAASAALLRRTVGQRWRTVHYLVYLAFWLGTVHGMLLGTDLQSGVVRAVPISLAIAVLFLLVRSRLVKQKRRLT